MLVWLCVVLFYSVDVFFERDTVFDIFVKILDVSAVDSGQWVSTSHDAIVLVRQLTTGFFNEPVQTFCIEFVLLDVVF